MDTNDLYKAKITNMKKIIVIWNIKSVVPVKIMLALTPA